MAEKTINTRIVLRNDTLANWEASTKGLLQGEVALANLGGDKYEIRVGVDGTKTWNELSSATGGSNVVFKSANVTDLLATIAANETNTTYQIISAALSAGETGKSFLLQSKEKGSETWTDVTGSRFNVPAFDPSALEADVKTLSTDLSSLSGEVALSVSALEGKITAEETSRKAADDALCAALSVDVRVEGGTGNILSSYVISQGGVDKTVKIDIPKDKVIEKASVVKFDTDEEAQEATGDPTAKAGTYLKLEILHLTKAIYVPVPELVNTYKGYDGKTISVDVVHGSGEEYTISAFVKEGSIGPEHLTTALSTEIKTIKTDLDAVEAAQAADRAAIEILSGDATVEGSVKKALADAKAYADGKVEALSTSLSTTVDAKIEAEKSARETAITNLSTELKGDIADEATARDTAIEAKGTVLSAYARETSANALVDAKAYTDAEIAKLSVGDTYETKADAAAKLTEAKSYTDALSTAVDGKITTARTDLSAYARETSANALVDAKAYTDSEITDLSVELKGDISTEVTNRTTAILNLSTSLSTTVSALVAAEKSRAETAEAAAVAKTEALSGEFATVSADHETRITANERAIDLLSSAVHFRGVISKSEISAAGDEPTEAEIKAGLVKKFKPCAKGDIAIYTDAGTEYIYTAETSESADGWVKLGDEGTYVTKATYNAKMAELDASDSALSGMVSAEETRAKGIETAISTDLYALSGAYETFVGTTYAGDKSALEAADSEISGKVDNKVKVGTYGSALTNKDTLSVMKIADEDYYKLVAEGKTNDDILYIVSSDYVNGHDQRVINVGNAISATDAVNLSGMNAAIDAAKQEIVANSLSGVTLNGVDFTVANNVATLSIDIINCGGAN